jgi:hypothetical protein
MTAMLFGMDASRMVAVEQLWSVHAKEAFPVRLTSVDVLGIEMAMLDADIAGCVSAWLHHDGLIDDRRWNVLAARERQLSRVLPELSGEEATYFRRLNDMVILIRHPSGVSSPR